MRTPPQWNLAVQRHREDILNGIQKLRDEGAPLEVQIQLPPELHEMAGVKYSVTQEYFLTQNAQRQEDRKLTDLGDPPRRPSSGH